MFNRWFFFIPILSAVALLLFLQKNQSEPLHHPATEVATYVKTIQVPRVSIAPKVTGYGTVQPAITWNAVAQVKGVIIEKHPALSKGAILPKGTRLIKIDPTDYELTIAQTQADIAATQAQLQELSIQEKNTRAALVIEQKTLALSRKALTRKRQLSGKGSVSHSDVESQQRELLQQQQSVLNKNNTLNLLPSQKALLDARLSQYQTTLLKATRNLSYTDIVMPFDGRISAVNVEKLQYIREGEALIQADDLSAIEVEIQLPIHRFSELMLQDNLANDLDSLNQHDSNIQASIHYQQGQTQISWPAKFRHLSDRIDPKTRTIGVIVEANTLDKPIPSQPPLARLKGLYVQVELTGKLLENQLIIPRSGLRGKTVYVVDADHRLVIRKVEVMLLQDEFALIASGLTLGDTLVISRLKPAVTGMLLRTEASQSAQDRLLTWDHVTP